MRGAKRQGIYGTQGSEGTRAKQGEDLINTTEHKVYCQEMSWETL